MIIAYEMQGLNDTRPFLLTWHYGDFAYSLNIEKNFTRAKLEEGWTVEQRGNKFLVTLEPVTVETDKDDGNGEHRYWKLTITDVTVSTDAKTIGTGDVSWGEFFLMD